MIDIPLGKVLMPVECKDDPSHRCTDGECFFGNRKSYYYGLCVKNLYCNSAEREDGKNVIFKLVDYPVEGKK